MNTIAEHIAHVLAEIKAENPYPESIFIPPTDEQFAMAHEALKREGWLLSKFTGDMGRNVWNNCIKRIHMALIGEEEGTEYDEMGRIPKLEGEEG